jgi:ribose 5-phosphate isomerase B
MKIAIGSDELAFDMKEAIKRFLQDQTEISIETIKDCGVNAGETVDYPDIAEKVARSIMSGECERGILVCGTGIGMAIAANKFPGIRAAQVYDPYSAERSRKSNNAQIMTLGALTMGVETAKYLVGIWLKCEFAGGRSARKGDKINAIDEQFRK